MGAFSISTHSGHRPARSPPNTSSPSYAPRSNDSYCLPDTHQITWTATTLYTSTPPFFEVYANLAEWFHLSLRIPFPLETDIRRAGHRLPFLEGFPHDLVRGMIVTNSACLKARQLAHPDRFICSFFGQEALTLETLLHLLDTLPSGTNELMCHPGYDEPALASSTYRRERETELALLTHPDVHKRVKRLGIELVTFDVLAWRSAAWTSATPEGY
jgi:predicted glycoside hydrolase/deacetylase ChbG (UPF0249 family)